MSDRTLVDTWKPDYARGCRVCGMKPTVTGLHHGQTVYKGGLCGACLWGDADMADPTEWDNFVYVPQGAP